MRENIRAQFVFGQVDMSEIIFDLDSRDDVPKILIGLQHVYNNPIYRKEVFEILDKALPEEIDRKKGRTGMDLWSIVVLGCVKEGCNIDYDRLHELSNQHRTLRQMMGHPVTDEEMYKYDRIRDNVSKLTPETINQINQVVVKAGHRVLGVEDQKLEARADSAVVKTDVHYPTDISLLFDAIRKSILIIALISRILGWSDWRMYKSYIKELKKACRKITKVKRSRGKDREERLSQAYTNYIDLVKYYVTKIHQTMDKIPEDNSLIEKNMNLIQDLSTYLDYVDFQINLTVRRALEGETIPHCEKIHSVFEPHTRWISKGKAGVAVEFGLPVCYVEDQFQFILNHKVMQFESDPEIAFDLIWETKLMFPQLSKCSFDKGFWSKTNLEQIDEIIEMPIMPKKGKLSNLDIQRESSEEFKQARQQHSAVESAIHSLQSHGLDLCRDHGIDGFKRHVAYGVLSHNLHRLGAIIIKKEQKKLHKEKMIA